MVWVLNWVKQNHSFFKYWHITEHSLPLFFSCYSVSASFICFMPRQVNSIDLCALTSHQALRLNSRHVLLCIYWYSYTCSCWILLFTEQHFFVYKQIKLCRVILKLTRQLALILKILLINPRSLLEKNSYTKPWEGGQSDPPPFYFQHNSSDWLEIWHI